MILYPKRIKQVLDFRGVGNSLIHPSDIDAVLEFDGEYLIIFEVKLKGVGVPIGQQRLFKEIADAWQRVNKEAFVVYCEHETDTDEVVNMANTTVTKIYHDGKNYKRNENIREFLFKLGAYYNIKKLIDAL